MFVCYTGTLHIHPEREREREREREMKTLNFIESKETEDVRATTTSWGLTISLVFVTQILAN